MNAVAKTEPKALSSEALEHVLGTGDLSRLTTQQRVEYYGQVCLSIGVNPLTRPFRFMTFQGQTVMYATRDLTDQLRSLRKISVSIVDKQLDGDLFIVTARATTADHRTDEDVGAVTMGQLRGDARANAIMKAMTKAKRRVTMSICGLGFLDETEVETMPGARTYDAEAEPAAPESTPAGPLPGPKQPVPPAKRYPVLYTANNGAWLAELVRVLNAATTEDEVVEIGGLGPVNHALSNAPANIVLDIKALLSDAMARISAPPEVEAKADLETSHE